MEPLIPDYLVASFILLTFLLFGLIVFGYRSLLIRSGQEIDTRKWKIRKLVIPLLAWLAFLAKISGMEFFHDWSAMPPRIAIAVLPPLVFVLVTVFSKKIDWLIRLIPMHWLIYIQSFRIVMELILLGLFLENIIPKQMTFEGLNYDILVGLTALAIGYYVFKGKFSNRGILAWNVFGLILLANIVVIAVLSTPLPLRVFMNEPANTVVAYFPFIWLPGFVVPVAYTMHFISIKKCLLEIRTGH